MSAAAPASDRSPNETGRAALFAGLIFLIALLLVASNVQLWRLVDHDETPATASSSRAPAAESTLPAPVSGTSNDVLSKRLRSLSSKVTTPLHTLTGQLTELQSLGTAQTGVSEQLSDVNASIRKFDAVRGQIGELSDGIGTMVNNTGRMSEGLGSLGASMKGTQTSMGRLLSVMSRVEGGIVTTSKATQQMSAATKEVSASTKEASVASQEASKTTAGLGASMNAMVEGISQTKTSMQEVNVGLGSINQTMTQLLTVICRALGNTSGPCVNSAEPVTPESPVEPPPTEPSP